MATIYVDNKPYEVDEGQNLLQACLSLGFDLPYFCWHPAMGSVGACRQCAVKQFKDENDTRGKIVMACMTAVADGVRISIDDPEAREFRRSVAEWLMLNHPHDCPVCDEGGECHLQDMTVMTGHTYRRYRGKKRTFHNQDLGPFVNHEMNRCIQCYRRVRFYRDHAGGRDFDAHVIHNHVYYGRHKDGRLQSVFSGNLVEVCPTGVFTDKTLKEHYTRKWDLQTAPSVCVHCGLGCNTIPGERYGTLRRIRNRYNGEVNGYFLCDRGRYGYEFVNSERRIRQPMVRTGKGEPEPATIEAALERAAEVIRGAKGVIGIGSPRASLEANFALRQMVGPDRFYMGVSDEEHRLLSAALKVLRDGPARSASLHDVEVSDAVFLLGEDVMNTAPMLGYALRQSVRQQPMQLVDELRIPRWQDASVRVAVQDDKGPFYSAMPYATDLDEIATKTHVAAPDDIARLGFAVAQEIGATVPEETVHLDAEGRALAREVADALSAAERPLVLVGTGARSEAMLQAAANVAWALCEQGKDAQLCLVVPEPNSIGVGLMRGNTLSDALKSVTGGEADTVVILENDLYRRGDPAQIDTLFRSAKHVIALDHLSNATTAHAEVLLPASTFVESTGTLVNNEGRAQRFLQVFAPDVQIQPAWLWLRNIMVAAGRAEAAAWETVDHVALAMAEELPDLQGAKDAAPQAGFRLVGQQVPRESHRYSGRTAMHADISVHEPKPPVDHDAPLSFSMEGYQGQPPAALIPRFWAAGWNSIQALNKFQQEVPGPLRGGDPGVRLIEPKRVRKIRYFDTPPEPSEPREGQWLVVPKYNIYGSEELSVLTPGIAAESPSTYIALHPDEAFASGLICDEEADVGSEETSHRVIVVLDPSLPRGVAAISMGLEPLPASALLGKWVRISK